MRESNVIERDVPQWLTRAERHNHGGGGGGGNMEARVAKLESDAEYIKRDIHEIKENLKDIRSDAKTDFRMLFGAIIAVALGLAGLMAKGFGWL